MEEEEIKELKEIVEDHYTRTETLKSDYKKAVGNFIPRYCIYEWFKKDFNSREPSSIEREDAAELDAFIEEFDPQVAFIPVLLLHYEKIVKNVEDYSVEVKDSKGVGHCLSISTCVQNDAFRRFLLSQVEYFDSRLDDAIKKFVVYYNQYHELDFIQDIVFNVHNRTTGYFEDFEHIQ